MMLNFKILRKYTVWEYLINLKLEHMLKLCYTCTDKAFIVKQTKVPLPYETRIFKNVFNLN